MTGARRGYRGGNAAPFGPPYDGHGYGRLRFGSARVLLCDFSHSSPWLVAVTKRAILPDSNRFTPVRLWEGNVKALAFRPNLAREAAPDWGAGALKDARRAGAVKVLLEP
jgi:hypothetical protein